MKFSEFLEKCDGTVDLRVRMFLFGTPFHAHGYKSYFIDLPALHDCEVEYFYTCIESSRDVLVVSLKYPDVFT